MDEHKTGKQIIFILQQILRKIRKNRNPNSLRQEKCSTDGQFLYQDSLFLDCIFANKWLGRILQVHNLSRRSVHIYVLQEKEADQRNYVMVAILGTVGRHCNYMTVVSDNPEQFWDIMEEIAMDTGLEIATKELVRDTNTFQRISKELVDKSPVVFISCGKSLVFQVMSKDEGTGLVRSVSYQPQSYLFDGVSIPGEVLQRKIFGREPSEELFRFNENQLPQEYKSRIMPEKTRKS